MEKIKINNYILKSPKLIVNKKIINMSDIHSNIEILKIIRKILEREQADSIFIPGDTIDAVNDIRNEQIIKELSKIGNISKTFISLGNHDIIKNNNSFFNELSKNSKCICLLNRYEKLDLDKNIVINSINMPISYYINKESKKESKKIIDNIKLNHDQTKFNILLSHTPNWIFENNTKMNYLEFLKHMNLILCGHNHGGLVPTFFQDFINNHYGLVGPYSKILQSNAYGVYNKDNTSVLISNGVTKISETSQLGKFNHILNKIFIPEIDIIYMEQSTEHSLKLKNRNIFKI